MAKFESITKSLSMKFNTFQYGNSDLFVSVTAKLEEGDDPSEVGEMVSQQVLKEFTESKSILDECDISMYKLSQAFK